MIDLTKQTQNTGDNSTAIQATNVTIIQQADRNEIEEVARAVIRREIETLADHAIETFKNRADDLIKNFITGIASNKNFNKERVQDPRFQFSLLDAQREYGKSGAAELRDELINLLIRMNTEQGDEITKLYAEAINVVPKLTRSQVRAIAVVCATRYLRYNAGDLPQLVAIFRKNVFPFLDGAARSAYDFGHIEYTRCGQVGIGSYSLQSVLSAAYRGIFLKGFSANDIPAAVTETSRQRFTMPCINNPLLLQIKALNLDHLNKDLTEANVPENEKQEIRGLFQRNPMSDSEIIELLKNSDARFTLLNDYIAKTAAKNLSLTSVGLIVGVVNNENMTGERIDLKGWFSEA